MLFRIKATKDDSKLNLLDKNGKMRGYLDFEIQQDDNDNLNNPCSVFLFKSNGFPSKEKFDDVALALSYIRDTFLKEEEEEG